MSLTPPGRVLKPWTSHGKFVEGGGLEDGDAAVGAGGPVFGGGEFGARFRLQLVGFRRLCFALRFAALAR